MGRKKCGRKGSLARQSKSKDNRNLDGPALAKEETKRTGIIEEKEESVEPGDTGSRKAAVPIDVYSRLTYPLLRSSSLSEDLSDSSRESDEEESVEFNFRPRFVFASNLCLICMEVSSVVCEFCGMVSYCSTKHRKQGWSKHRDLCEILTEIRGKGYEPTLRLTAEDYRVYRFKLLSIVQSGIGRSLDLWEKEIVLYPRVCRVCRDVSSENLLCCALCGMEYFCKDHGDRHEKWCQEFKVFRRCLFLQHRHGRVDPRIPAVRRGTAVDLPGSFDELMLGIYGCSRYYREMDCHTYTTLSHVCTIPLTALHSMQISCPEWRSRTDWTIHILGAEFQFEGINLRVWEKLFLHFLPSLKRLSLTLLGPELRLPAGVSPELLSKVRLCSGCQASGKTVSVLFRPGMLYHELAPREIAAADLVCLFNPGLYRKTGFEGQDTWPDTIREFCKARVPVAVTSYTEEEIPREIERINSLADIEILLEPRRNPFASIKPDRNFVSDDTAPLIYKNYYLTIVKGK